MNSIPTLKQLFDGILADLEAEYGISISLFGKVALRATAAVQAGKLKLLYLVVGFVQKNIFVDTADPEALGGTLERFGRIKLNRNPFQPQAGKYDIIVTGEIGAVIPASTTFKSDDDSLSPGFLFILDNAYTMVTGSDVINVRSLTAGLSAQLADDDTLTATQPIALVDSTATVDSEIVQPLAGETIEEYRAKIKQAFQLEPQGGAATDYRLWSYDVQGVRQSYPYAKSGAPDVIDVFVESTIEDSTDGRGTPSSLMLDAVREVIEFDPDTTQATNDRGRRPLGVYAVNCLAVTPKSVDIEIVGYGNLTADIQAAIGTALEDMLFKMRPFVAGCDVLADKNDIIDIYRVSFAIISAVPGSLFTGINLTIDGTPLTTYQFILGNIGYINSITYTP